MSIFNPRKSTAPSTALELTLAVEPTVVELTKNDKYCVARLPALPAVLDDTTLILNGYTDNRTRHAVAVGESTIHVWNYRLTDSTPLVYEFPIDPSNVLPLAILTNPSSGARDPGVVIINTELGHVRFYESVQHAPALGIINNKSLEAQIGINARGGEHITLAENVEPAGIVVATSWKRVVLVTIRDFKNKPALLTTELLAPAKSLFLTGWLRPHGVDDKKVANEIVSIKSGAATNLSQEIIVQDSHGGFYKFVYQAAAADGVPYVDSKKTSRHGLASYFENNLDGFIPGSALNVKFLDLAPVTLENLTDMYAALILVADDFKGSGNRLFIVTVRIDDSGVLLYGSHRLTSYKLTPIASINKPKLYVPQGNSAFVVIDNVVILTDITQPGASARWEDAVVLSSSVNLIGLGHENPTRRSHPALVLLTGNSGVLRVERFPNTDPVDANTIIKSHIEQAIYYNELQAIDFDRSDDSTRVAQVIVDVANEVVSNTSPYLPKFLPSISDFLSKKASLLHELIKYTERNYPSLRAQVVPNILHSLEKTQVAYHLWKFVSKSTALQSELAKLIGPGDDVFRTFFSDRVSDINSVFTRFVEDLLSNGYATSELVHVLVQTMYYGVYENEHKFAAEIPVFRLWVFDTELLIRIEEVYTKAYCENGDFLPEQARADLIKLTEVLYFLCTNAISYMQWEGELPDQLAEYVRWYSLRKNEWMRALTKNNLVEEAMLIAEKYQDFSSLAEVLSTSEAANYEPYFDKYGYDFALSLYGYYLKSDNVKSLLLGFGEYNHYLQRYFDENPAKVAHVAWIRELLDGQFGAGSKTLIHSANAHANDFQDNRELKFALAKLAAVAAKKSGTIGLEDVVADADANLVQIGIQTHLYQDILRAVDGEVHLLSLEYILSNFINTSISTSRAAVEKAYPSFSTNRPLSKSDLISLLSVVKPSLYPQGFADALKVAEYLDQEDFSYHAQLVWLRVVNADDWLFLESTLANSDDYNKYLAHETALYKTLAAVSKAAVAELDKLVSTKGQSYNSFEDYINVDEDDSVHVFASNLDKYNLVAWIDALKADV